MTHVRHYEIVALAGGEDRLGKALVALIAAARLLPGWESGTVYGDPLIPTRFILIEHWSDEQAHAAAAGLLDPVLVGEIQAAFAIAPVGGAMHLIAAA